MAYDSEVANDPRYVVPQADKKITSPTATGSELGFDTLSGFKEASVS